MRKWGVMTGLVLAVVGRAQCPSMADSIGDFYSGKTVTLVIGTAAGGAFDAYGRLIARHIADHIPGKPSIAVQNMPGAIKTANYLYNASRKDGTEFGIVAPAVLMEPLFGNQQARFDGTKFSWLGSAAQEIAFCGVGPGSGITSFDQWLKSGKELTFGASGVGSTTYQHPMILKNVLGANLKIVNGYDGNPNIALAVKRGEMDGVCAVSASTARVQYKPMIDSGEMKLIVQMGAHKDPGFPDVPSVFDFAKTDEQKQILSLAFDQLALGRPFIAPPGIPEDRHSALTHAFADTLKDPSLMAEADKMKLEIDYTSGDEAKNLLEKFSAYPPSVLEKAKLALNPE